MLRRWTARNFALLCARSHRIPRARRGRCTLQAQQLQTAEQRRDAAASERSRWSPTGVRVARDPPGRERQLSPRAAEFDSPSRHGGLRERRRTLRCLGTACSRAGVHKRRRDSNPRGSASEIEISRSARWVDVPPRGVFFPPDIQRHETLKAPGFRKHREPP